MTPHPPEREPAFRTASIAFGSGLAIALLIAVAGQAIAFVVFLVRGASGSYASYARLGALYVEAFHHVDVGIRVLPVGGAREASVHLGVALLTVSAVGLVLLALQGRRFASRATGGALVVAVPASSVAYAIVSFVVALLARGHVDLPSTVPAVRAVDVTVSAAEAFVVPLALAASAVAIGALVGLPRGDGAGGDAAIADVVAGGVRSFALGLALSVVGVLMFATVQPAFARAYGSVVTAFRSPQGRLAVGSHLALLVPNQAVWVLVPAMGGSDDAVLEVRPEIGARPPVSRETAFLSYGIAPIRAPIRAPIGRDGPVSPGLRPAPKALLAFLVVPLIATLAGGMRAARDGSARSKRATLGAASGVMFAALTAVAIALSRVDVDVTGPFLGTSTLRLSMGPGLVVGTALAAGWGIVGGAVGGVLARPSATTAAPGPRPRPR